MLIRTHLAIAILIILLFVNHVESQFLFIGMVLLATLVPDIDSAFSKIGSYKIFRFFQFFIKHRGVLHSLTFAVIFGIVLSIFWPVAAFGFFLGYALHIFADSFTKEGVSAFWPSSKRSQGLIRTGSHVETVLFIFFIIADLLALIFIYFV